MIVAVVFQFSLVCFYMIYQICRAPYDTNTFLITIAYSTRTFYFYSQIVFAMKYGTMLSNDVISNELAVSSENVSHFSSQATNTSHIVNKALNLPLNKATLNQVNSNQLNDELRSKFQFSFFKLQQFLQQICHSNTSVSCGLFSIDWTLFHSVCVHNIMAYAPQ